MYPETQLHVYELTLSTQVAPFWQGLLAHSLISVEKVKLQLSHQRRNSFSVILRSCFPKAVQQGFQGWHRGTWDKYRGLEMFNQLMVHLSCGYWLLCRVMIIMHDAREKSKVDYGHNFLTLGRPGDGYHSLAFFPCNFLMIPIAKIASSYLLLGMGNTFCHMWHYLDAVTWHMSWRRMYMTVVKMPRFYHCLLIEIYFDVDVIK